MLPLLLFSPPVRNHCAGEVAVTIVCYAPEDTHEKL